MIQANSLRLGNWVEEEVLGRVRIVAILSDTVAVVGKGMKMDRAIEDREFSLNLSNIKPVPLTPEILEKCGFKTAYTSFHDGTHIANLKKDGFELQYDSRIQDGIIVSPPKIDDGFVVHCRFVHQLQNLYFSLQGQELTINL